MAPLFCEKRFPGKRLADIFTPPGSSCAAGRGSAGQSMASMCLQPRNLHCRFESLFIFGIIRLFIIISESNGISGIDWCTTGLLRPILCFCFPEMLVDTAVNSLSEFLVYKPSFAHAKILTQIQNPLRSGMPTSLRSIKPAR